LTLRSAPHQQQLDLFGAHVWGGGIQKKCTPKLHAKFQNPRTTPSGRKECGGERK
jgi:hypothetical protein